MATSYPEQPDFRGNAAEERVWTALMEQLPEDATVFHSLELAHLGEREIDFLVLWPGVGAAVLEVKGGVVRRSRGRWFSRSHGGQDHAIENPVDQARAAKHKLRSYLAGTNAHRARFAELAVFPFTKVGHDFHSPGTPLSVVAGRDDLPDLAGKIMAAIHAEGIGGTARTTHADGVFEDLLTALLADTADVGAARATAVELEEHADHLTENQRILLDFLAEQPRLHIQGTAGSGKTYLALEQARRLAHAGKRVAVVCFNQGLGGHLSEVEGRWKKPAAYVGTFHDLAEYLDVRLTPHDGAGQLFYDVLLPQSMACAARALPLERRFDAIVVDEAQDFRPLWWETLLLCLADRGGDGLYVFSDSNQSIYHRRPVRPLGMTPFSLRENLRNTKQIANLAGAFTGREQRVRGLAGEPVELIDVPAADAVAAADDAVERLLEDGWEPGQIALLTTKYRHPEQDNQIRHLGRAGYWATYFGDRDVFYSSVQGFKGLERSVVVLAVNGWHEGLGPELLYTGMSRARSKLVVVGPRGEIEACGGPAVVRRLAEAAPARAGAVVSPRR
jgi:hypothetical protein